MTAVDFVANLVAGGRQPLDAHTVTLRRTHLPGCCLAALLALPMAARAAPPATDAAPGAVMQADAGAAVGQADAADRQLLLTLRALPQHYRPDVSYGGYGRAPGRDARRRIARALSKAHGLRLLDDWAIPALGVDCFVLEAPTAGARAATIAALAADPRVESAEPVRILHPSALQRQRLALLLRVLDASLGGASNREIGTRIVYPWLAGTDAVAWKATSERRRVQRLLDEAHGLSASAYRDLLTS